MEEVWGEGGRACAYELQYLGLGSAASVDTMEEGGGGRACVYEVQYLGLGSAASVDTMEEGEGRGGGVRI